MKMTTEDGSLEKQERIWAKVGIEKWGMGWRGGFHGTGSEEEEERSSFNGRAGMTGPLLKLPLIITLQPTEEQRRRHCAER